MAGSNPVIENKEALRELFGRVWDLYDRVPENLRGIARELVDKWLNGEIEYHDLVRRLELLAAAENSSVAEAEYS